MLNHEQSEAHVHTLEIGISIHKQATGRSITGFCSMIYGEPKSPDKQACGSRCRFMKLRLSPLITPFKYTGTNGVFRAGIRHTSQVMY
jgi:hypothetical protein